MIELSDSSFCFSSSVGLYLCVCLVQASLCPFLICPSEIYLCIHRLWTSVHFRFLWPFPSSHTLGQICPWPSQVHLWQACLVFSNICVSVKYTYIRSWCEHGLKVKPLWIKNLFIFLIPWKQGGGVNRFTVRIDSLYWVLWFQPDPSLQSSWDSQQDLCLPVLLLMNYSWCTEIQGVSWIGSLFLFE